MADPITSADLRRIYVVIDSDDGTRRVNVTVAEMSDRQFRAWITAKAELAGLRLAVPVGRIGYETRVYLLNRLVQAGVRIYMVPA